MSEPENKPGSILQVVDLSFNYPGSSRRVLEGISLDIRTGERTVLLGPNGAGKSTLFYLMLGLFRPEQGKVFFKGEELGEIEEERLRRSIGYIFQNPDDQVFAPTVKEDILFGPGQLRLNPSDYQARLDGIIELLEIGDLLERNSRNLSYGEKKRVALAGILIMDPELIFLDEPLAFLDPPGQRLILKIMVELANRGKTLMVATHNLDYAAEWGNRFIILSEGRVLEEGDRDLLRGGITALDGSRPLPGRIFQGYTPPADLPVTVEEGREFLAARDLSLPD